jgi:hypothetical protein
MRRLIVLTTKSKMFLPIAVFSALLLNSGPAMAAFIAGMNGSFPATITLSNPEENANIGLGADSLLKGERICR